MIFARLTVAALLSAALAGPVAAVEPDEVLRDPVLEGRARAISAELRCLVCQNQSIDDSDAALARDLRLLVRERLQAGDSDGQIRQFLVQRYGEFVLLKPSLSAHTALLWIGPFVLFTAAALGLLVARRRTGRSSGAELSQDEAARLQALTDGDAVRRPSPAPPAT